MPLAYRAIKIIYLPAIENYGIGMSDPEGSFAYMEKMAADTTPDFKPAMKSREAAARLLSASPELNISLSIVAVIVIAIIVALLGSSG